MPPFSQEERENIKQLVDLTCNMEFDLSTKASQAGCLEGFSFSTQAAR